jgi:hypothetical protein
MPRHLLEHVDLALLRGDGETVGGASDVAAGGVVPGWRLHEARHQRRLRQSDFAGGLAEVALGGGFDPIALVPVVDAIQVRLEDLVLRVPLVDLEREDHLAELAAHRRLAGFLGVEHRVSDELLGDGRGTRQALAGQRDVGRAEGRERIEALVGVEVDVLGGQGGLHEVRRHLLEWHDGPSATVRIVDLPQELAVAIEDLGCLEAHGAGALEH